MDVHVLLLTIIWSSAATVVANILLHEWVRRIRSRAPAAHQGTTLMGYTNRTVRIEFPELGEDIWVAIRNPLIVPLDVLRPDVEVEYDDTTGRALDSTAATEASYSIVAKLLTSWHVPDPLDESDDPPSLPLPATPDVLAKVPALIIRRINEYVGKALSPEIDNTTTTSTSP